LPTGGFIVARRPVSSHNRMAAKFIFITKNGGNKMLLNIAGLLFFGLCLAVILVAGSKIHQHLFKLGL
jgi:hypothetical protein